MSENSFLPLDRHEQSDLWKKLKQNCSFLLLEFVIDDLSTCLGVCKTWNRDIKRLLGNKCSQMATHFSNKTHDYIRFQESFVNITRSQRKMGRYRITFTLLCQPRKSLKGLNVILSHKYVMTHRQGKELFSNYCFDCLRDKEPRSAWVLYEDSKQPHIPQVISPMPILQLKCQDYFRIHIKFWSGEGLMDFSSLIWQPPVVRPRTHFYSFPKSLIDSVYDPLRSSDIEVMAKWRDDPRDPIRKAIPKDYLEPAFERLSVVASGLDSMMVKAIFKASQPGRRGSQGTVHLSEAVKAPEEREGCSLNLTVKAESVVQSVPRAGYLQEGSGLSIKLAVGDYLVFYYRRL